MPVFNNILAGAAGSGGAAAYEIERSLRFNKSDSAYLSKNFASAGNRKTWTWSGWVKRSEISEVGGSADQSFLWGCSGNFQLYFGSNKIFLDSGSGGSYWGLGTDRKFRDPSAWYHIVLVHDTTESAADDRFKIYVNGVQETSFATDIRTGLTQNSDGFINNAAEHLIGKQPGQNVYSAFQLADVHFIDGQALAPTNFGKYDDNNVWQPKAYSGTYGTNGFHLDFSDNSTPAALGDDSSGNNNDWTVNNIGAASGTVWSSYVTGTAYSNTYLATEAFDGNANTGNMSLAANGATMTFTPPSAIPVTSSLRIWGNKVGSGGDLTINGTSVASQMAANSYQWNTITGFSNITSIAWSSQDGNNAFLIAAFEVDGTILVDGVDAAEVDSLVDSPTNGDQEDTGAGGEVVGNYATMNPLDKDANCTLSNGNLDVSCSTSGWFGANATMQVIEGKTYFEATYVSGSYVNIGLNTPNTGVGDVNTDGVHLQNDNGTWRVRNGSSAASISAVNANSVIGVAVDTSANTIQFFVNGSSVYSGTLNALHRVPLVYGYGTYSVNVNFGQRAFAYTAPSGFKALCTANLTDPTIADGSTAMDALLFTGNGGSQTLSGLGFSPDFTWFKTRSVPFSHELLDIVRGGTKVSFSDLTNAESTNGSLVTSFNSDGVSIGSALGANGSSRSSVLWAWDAGTSTVSNTDGSITSSVRASQTNGCSIVSFNSGSAGSKTIGHGLNAAPAMIIVKNREATSNWTVYHSSGTSTSQYLLLNTSNAVAGYTNIWGSADPTSSVFGFASGANQTANEDMIAYCFAPVAGYSAFGSYEGNGQSGDSGPFVHLGFRAKFILLKNADLSGSNWFIFDTSRNTFNVVDLNLKPNSSAEEETDSSGTLDILSNGFKMRSSGTHPNGNGNTIIYAAFAEHPLRHARAR